MTVSAISHYRGGSIDEVVPLSRALKAIYATYGVSYRLGRFETGPNAGDWCVVVTYADAAARAAAEARFAQDEGLQRIFIAISQFAKRISREVIEDIEL